MIDIFILLVCAMIFLINIKLEWEIKEMKKELTKK